MKPFSSTAYDSTVLSSARILPIKTVNTKHGYHKNEGLTRVDELLERSIPLLLFALVLKDLLLNLRDLLELAGGLVMAG